MVKQTVLSPFSKARAKAAGEGQAVEEAVFSSAMAASITGTSSKSLSTNSWLPTWMRRGTSSKATLSLEKSSARRSQLLSLTIFQIISFSL